MFVWTKNKPTEPGWYWYKRMGGDVDIVYVRWYGKKLCIMNWEIADDAEWAGPIPEPNAKHNTPLEPTQEGRAI